MATADVFVATAGCKSITEELESVLVEAFPEEDNAVSQVQRKPRKQRSQPLEGFSDAMLHSTIQELLTDDAVQTQIKAEMKKIDVQKLACQLDWINGCLTDKCHLLPVSREKVWSAYHECLIANLKDISEVTGSRLTSSVICLRLMKHLVSINYTPNSSSVAPPVDLAERDKDILAYVAGFILRRLRSNPLATHLESETPTGLVATKNRGGLIQPSDDFGVIVEEMEKVYRQQPERSVNRDLFFELLLMGKVSDSFMGIFKVVSCTSDAVDDFFLKICKIFFKVRSHHKCRFIVEEHVRINKTKRKTKALRDSI